MLRLERRETRARTRVLELGMLRNCALLLFYSVSSITMSMKISLLGLVHVDTQHLQDNLCTVYINKEGHLRS